MKVVANNIDKNKCKEVMNALLVCVKDKSISVEKRNEYYSEYLKLAGNYLKM